jgi:hypothetical protein
VRVAIRKLSGVESVEVSLERASAQILLRPDNRVTMPQLRKIIKDNGFSAKDATVTATGTLVERGGSPALNVTGIDVVWPLASGGAQSQAYTDAIQRLKTRPAETIEVVGTLPAPANPDAPEELVISSLKAAGK